MNDELTREEEDAARAAEEQRIQAALIAEGDRRYIERQFARLGVCEVYKLKLWGIEGETNKLNASPVQIEKIKAILKEG